MAWSLRSPIFDVWLLARHAFRALMSSTVLTGAWAKNCYSAEHKTTGKMNVIGPTEREKGPVAQGKTSQRFLPPKHLSFTSTAPEHRTSLCTTLLVKHTSSTFEASSKQAAIRACRSPNEMNPSWYLVFMRWHCFSKVKVQVVLRFIWVALRQHLLPRWKVCLQCQAQSWRQHAYIDAAESALWRLLCVANAEAVPSSWWDKCDHCRRLFPF